jgi:hypothetical protein
MLHGITLLHSHLLEVTMDVSWISTYVEIGVFITTTKKQHGDFLIFH